LCVGVLNSAICLTVFTVGLSLAQFFGGPSLGTPQFAVFIKKGRLKLYRNIIPVKSKNHTKPERRKETKLVFKVFKFSNEE